MLQINEKDNKLFDMIVKFKMVPYDMTKKYTAVHGQLTTEYENSPVETTFKKSITTLSPLARQV